MDIAIYVSDGGSAAGVRRLVDAVGELPRGYSIRVSDVSSGGPVPAEVVRVMVRRRSEALPLVLVDGVPALSGRLPSAYELLSLLPDDGSRPAVVTEAETAVDFPSPSRLHVSLNVTSLDESVPFYEVLFGGSPAKLKPFYAKFELTDPPLNITLNERPFERVPGEGAVGHFGIQVKSSEAVRDAMARCAGAGLSVEQETETACCYSVQTKAWVGDPDGNRWEVFVTTSPESEVFCPPDCLCYARMSPKAIQPVAASRR